MQARADFDQEVGGGAYNRMYFFVYKWMGL